MKRMAQVADRITRDKRAIGRAMDLPAKAPAQSGPGGVA
jgi:hypothetical protein